MTDQWIVLVETGQGTYAYGPTEDEDTAVHFAAFLTAEVDPARPLKLQSPTRELLGWWAHGRNEAREEWAREGMAMAADPDPDYGKDLDDEDEELPF